MESFLVRIFGERGAWWELACVELCELPLELTAAGSLARLV